jgi:hypothetical protein
MSKPRSWSGFKAADAPINDAAREKVGPEWVRAGARSEVETHENSVSGCFIRISEVEI